MTKKLLIEGMKCKHCKQNLNDALTDDIKGVEVLEISIEEGYALVDINEDDFASAVVTFTAARLVTVVVNEPKYANVAPTTAASKTVTATIVKNKLFFFSILLSPSIII